MVIRFLVWSIGALVVLVCVAFGSMVYGLSGMLEDEWYTASIASSGNGNVAIVRSYCSVVDWDVAFLVYVHRAGAPNSQDTLVFENRGDCAARPLVLWLSARTVKIKNWPTTFRATTKRTRFGEVAIVYATFTVPRRRRRS